MTRHRRATGGIKWNGMPHIQPTVWRRAWCLLTGGHMPKFSAYPSDSCVRCGWWPDAGTRR